MKEYGQPDADLTAYNVLLASVDVDKVAQIMHHPRKPIDARMCQMPGSLLVQAVMLDGSVISVRQNSLNGPARVIS